MTDFKLTNWANADFAQQYRDNADIYIVERRRMFEIMKSFYHHFIAGKKKMHILDLGCGDGIITSELLSIDPAVSSTLIDGSEHMLGKARERLHTHKNMHYRKISFQELLETGIIDEEFHFIVSSMAIHHLPLNEKKALFRFIYDHLRDEGCFMNIDAVLPPNEVLDKWYMKIWQEWMDAEQMRLGIGGERFDTVIKRYKDNNDNKPDTLEDQLDALKEIGYNDVDCYYKYGIFAVYGGRK